MNHVTDDNFGRLQPMNKFGSGIGFHRMEWLLSGLLSNPWFRSQPSIRITGSNGKGSVCAMLDSMFKALQIGCGLYTSPHLLRFNERFKINGVDISDEELSRSVDWFLERRQAYNSAFPEDRIGSFEAYTAIGLHYFASHEPDVIVAEVGIGGRYDPVRFIPGTLVGLTSLDLEHTQLLGNSLELIAYDKTDLCPDGGTVVVGKIEADTLQRLRAYCQIRKIDLRSIEEHSHLHQVTYTDSAMRVDLDIDGTTYNDLEISLQGPHQVHNATIAIMLLRAWLQENRPQMSEDEIRAGIHEGMRTAQWAGRFQRIGQNPDVYIDVGHTPDAIDFLLRTVKEALPEKRILLITGVSEDKNAEEIVARLVKVAERVICTRAYHKGSQVSRIVDAARRERPDLPIDRAETIEEAVALGIKLARENDMTILVAGGLFLAIEAAQAFRGENPRELHFH
jgi:dihydrofolate synthase/folylpolyglutamate synthase